MSRKRLSNTSPGDNVRPHKLLPDAIYFLSPDLDLIQLSWPHPSFLRSEEHTSELQSHSFISYAVFCLKKKKNTN